MTEIFCGQTDIQIRKKRYNNPPPLSEQGYKNNCVDEYEMHGDIFKPPWDYISDSRQS